ncbi:MAG: hypothetical protein AAGH89_14850 [Verrucomicrobiota bacterium]
MKLHYAFFLCLLTPLYLLADDDEEDNFEELRKSELPESVLVTVQKHFPEGRIREAGKTAEDGAVVYIVMIQDRTGDAEMGTRADGTLLFAEQKVNPRKLPKPVGAAIGSNYPRAKIEEALFITEMDEEEGEIQFFLVILETRDERLQVAIRPGGEILEVEPVEETGEDDDE